MIQNIMEWTANPFHFRLYHGSIACNKKGVSASILMIDVERKKISIGLEFFCQQFDGINPLSPCGITYLFFTSLQNQPTDTERKSIIDDINHHIGKTNLIHIYGLTNLDTQVTLKQNVTIRLWKLLLSLCAP